MKKNILKRLISTAAFACSIFFYTGCQDVIFYNIRQEVPLEDSTIGGDIYSIVRFGSDLYIANGNIYSKSANNTNHGAWSKKSKPSGNVIFLAADSSYLYCISGTIKKDDEEGDNRAKDRSLYASTDGSSWTKIRDFGYSSSSDLRIFCTNSTTAANRKAYLRYGSSIYELNGTSLPAAAMTAGSTDASTSPTSDSKSCVSFNGTVYFFNSYAAATNETAAGNDATYFYYSDKTYGSSIKYGNASNSSIGSSNPGVGSIYSIAVTNSAILLGTSGGIHKVSNSTGIPGSSPESFSTNAASSLSNQYMIWALLCLDPSKIETDAIIYASSTYSGTGADSAQFNHIGLWSYYPSRGNWNRE